MTLQKQTQEQTWHQAIIRASRSIYKRRLLLTDYVKRLHRARFNGTYKPLQALLPVSDIPPSLQADTCASVQACP